MNLVAESGELRASVGADFSPGMTLELTFRLKRGGSLARWAAVELEPHLKYSLFDFQRVSI